MQRKRIITEDGAHSFYIEELDEHYHSIYGAVQESETVFIQAGLLYQVSRLDPDDYQCLSSFKNKSYC